jgi:NAD(P)H-hydrate epimerase
MTQALPETGDGSLSQAAYEELVPVLQGKKAVVLGPGLGLHADTVKFARRLMKGLSIPVVVDADALTAMADDMQEFSAGDNSGLVLTPHPGEMARLCGCTVQEAQEDRIKSATELACRTGAVVVLKGARTVTAAPDGRVCINITGNSGMGTGGMGDVLSGIIGALLAQGYRTWEAARLGVCAHGLAADMLAPGRGPWGWTAGDLAAWLPRVWSLPCSN